MTVLFILGGLLGGVFFRSLAIEVANVAHWETVVVGGVLPLTTLVGVATGILTFFVLLRNERTTVFTDSVVTELKRVTWPSREETLANTGIVVGATIFFATLLSGYDFLWAKLTGLFLYTTG